MKKNSLIRTIYLYLFTIVGLILIIISSVDFIDMGLKAFIFTQADQQERIYSKMPPTAPRKIVELADTGKTTSETKIELTKEEKLEIDAWIIDYTNWKERNENFDSVTSQRQRDASRNIAMLLVGLPLYLYHWSVIKKETKEKGKE